MSNQWRLCSVAALLVLTCGAWFIYQRFRPPYDLVEVESDLLEIRSWSVNDVKIDKWPGSFGVGKPIQVELIARPARPLPRREGSAPEAVSLFFIEKAKPAQPVKRAGGLLSEMSEGGDGLKRIGGPNRGVMPQTPTTSKRGPVASPDRFRTYSGWLQAPLTAGEYVLLVAVDPQFGTFAPDDLNHPGGLRVVRRIDVEFVP